MFVLGHAGITLGTAALLNSVLAKSPSSRPEQPLQERNAIRSLFDRVASQFAALGKRIDTRVLLIGSLLPDIIDKPLGYIFFRESISNVRIFGHTLLFLILITVTGLFIYRYRGRTWLLALSFGTLTHLVFDQIWREPQTLFWPICGVVFDRIDLSAWGQNLSYLLTNDPATYIPEITGGIILVFYLWVVVSRSRRL